MMLNLGIVYFFCLLINCEIIIKHTIIHVFWLHYDAILVWGETALAPRSPLGPRAKPYHAAQVLQDEQPQLGRSAGNTFIL